MKAVIITRFGGPEVLEIQEVPTPSPVADQVLVQVKASALNRADIHQREGKYPAPADSPQNISGLEFAGVVVESGPAARLYEKGRRVFGITGGGAHAEYIIAHQRTLAAIPDNLSWSEAAAIPEAFITAHDALWKQAALHPSESVLIHAVGSGVGLAATQLVRAIGAVPYGTSRTLDKLQRAKQEYGLQAGVQLRESMEPLVDFTKIVTHGKGFDLILDLVGGAYVAADVQALALKGRVMLLASSAGGKAEFNLGQFLGKRAQIIGTVLRARPLEEKIIATQAFAKEVVPLFAAGKLRATIDSEFPLAEIQSAHKRMESNETFGKIVLTI
ncbi:MAG: NAD(P)H-quinone oxidoreductase [Acidobacteriales bacterium]|nr:NAD(P)H-quinone oxidoreductase [Terriglobales bacterium]